MEQSQTGSRGRHLTCPCCLLLFCSLDELHLHSRLFHPLHLPHSHSYSHSYSMDTDSMSDTDSQSDTELQEAFAKGLLKPGLNVVLEAKKKCPNDVEGMARCLANFKKDLPWVERLDMTNGPAADIVAKAEGKSTEAENSEINVEDDFQREMYFYRQAQATVLKALPKLHSLKVATQRPEDYFAEMAKSDQQMHKVRQKLMVKQIAMEKSEKAKQLRALRKYGKKVQVEVIQKRQKEKKAMLTAVKKYQKGLSDKLDFLEGDRAPSKGQKEAGGGGSGGGGGQHKKKGINAKRKHKNEKFGFGGKKRGLKWNTKDSYDDVSSFRSKVAHSKNKNFGKGGKGKINANKRPGKRNRQKMKNRSRS
uniref:Putative rRNA-processing protein EBP2 n=1 Tax=Callorhinchus milii TaxID=7868 RepID=V9KYA2_CALMI|eukprot:gi/632963747/ref/XP_007898057.1/ PREDICTED: probable rRNA-processing protein EBP2 [Callorhinchus milii]